MYGLWNRLQYMLSPQFDIYEQVSKVVYGKVADVGCGTGFGTHLLTRNASEVMGFEVDPTAFKFAKRAFGNGSIDFSNKDIVKDLIEGKFDFVTMIDVIEHIKEDTFAIRQCYKLLSGDGKFICSTPNRLSRYRKSEYHVREYSPNELRTLLKTVFENVDIVNYKLSPIESEYENPIIGICQ